MFCPSCGKEISNDVSYCPSCGADVKNFGTARHTDEPNVIYVTETKSEGLALVLSFLIPGLGQMYDGKIVRGLGFLFICPILALILLFLPGFYIFGFALIIPIIVWIYGVYDAYRLAQEYNDYLHRYNKKPW